MLVRFSAFLLDTVTELLEGNSIFVVFFKFLKRSLIAIKGPFSDLWRNIFLNDCQHRVVISHAERQIPLTQVLWNLARLNLLNIHDEQLSGQLDPQHHRPQTRQALQCAQLDRRVVDIVVHLFRSTSHFVLVK